MSDDLRTRIVSAIEAGFTAASASGYGSEYVSEEGDGIYKLDGTFNLFALADAVIRELEYRYVLVPKNVTLVQWADEAFKGQPEGNFKHEHVTEWAADA